MDRFRHVSNALRALMKGVQANGEVDEDDLDDVVRSLRSLPHFLFNYLLNLNLLCVAHQIEGAAKPGIHRKCKDGEDS